MAPPPIWIKRPGDNTGARAAREPSAHPAARPCASISFDDRHARASARRFARGERARPAAIPASGGPIPWPGRRTTMRRTVSIAPALCAVLAAVILLHALLVTSTPASSLTRPRFASLETTAQAPRIAPTRPVPRRGEAAWLHGELLRQVRRQLLHARLLMAQVRIMVLERILRLCARRTIRGRVSAGDMRGVWGQWGRS